MPLLSELPEALQRQIPKITITGTVYSDDPKKRLLLVNNQVLPQGSVLAPEITLEGIRPRSSVFNFRGTRFRISH
ncbi:MAG: general secretion pathway protein GspB [Betaproteobacteria bacterium]|nr:general secretion pathway protein GspB [Betaproteobacteria bacterium]